MKLIGKAFLWIRKALGWILLLPVYFYKMFLSPILPPMCRFQPTCSTFMVEAIKKKGPIWGLILGIYRILRCNPFNPGGYDPVERWPPYWTGKKWVWKITPEVEEKLTDAQVKYAEEQLSKHKHHSDDSKIEDNDSQGSDSNKTFVNDDF